VLGLLRSAAVGTAAWWLGILAGIAVGAPIAFFVHPTAGRLVGGAAAGAIAGAIEARGTTRTRGRRGRFTLATALVTALAAALLLDVHGLPWLVGAAFGAATSAAQAASLRLGPRALLARALSSAVGWSVGFAVLHSDVACWRLGVLGPAVAALVLAALERSSDPPGAAASPAR
jgi:hypothetical protein